MGPHFRTGITVTRRGPDALHLNAGVSRSATLRGLDTLEHGMLIRALRSSAPRQVSFPFLLRPHIAARLLECDIFERERPELSVAFHGVDLLSLSLIVVLAESFTLCVDPRSPKTVAAPLHHALGSAALGTQLPTAMATALSDTDVTVAPVSSPDLVLCTSRHAPDPALFASFLAQDQPYLPIVIAADGYELGPVSVPGRSACARCVMLRRAESDAFYPAEVYACQTMSAPTPPFVALHAALVHLSQMIHAFAAPEQAPTPSAQIVRIDAFGSPHVLTVVPHPHCGCGAAGVPFSAIS